MIPTAILVFLAGMLTFLAPCTLPVLPAYLAFSSQQTKTSALMRTIMFGVGLSFVFIMLGLFAGTLGAVLAGYKGVIAKASGVLFIILGVLVLMGKGIPGFTINANPSRTILGSMFFGMIFALSWSGCIGPVLGFVLILAANTQTALSGAALLFIYALGLLAPLLLVSVFIDRLPRNGKVWRFMRGRTFKIGKYKVQSTELITAIMLFLLGLIFIFNIDHILASSAFIDKIFDWEEALASRLDITLIT